MIFRVAKNYLNMNFKIVKTKKYTFLNRLATPWNDSATPSLRTTALREHFIILQTLWECYFWMFSEHSETTSNI